MKRLSILLVLSPLAATVPGRAQLGQAQAPGHPAAEIGGEAPFLSSPIMTLANGIAGLGDVVTGGNGHTGGCAWVDYNGDYLSDLFVLNTSNFDHYLFRNEGDGTFTDVSSLVAKPNIALESAGIACADIDNDGDTDIFVAVDHPFVNVNTFNTPTGGPNLLYVNQGDGTFVEDAAGWGVVDSRGWRNITVNLADVNLDGLVDAYFGSWAPNFSAVHDRTNVMYLNDGTGFTAYASGAEDGLETLTALFWDKDQDLYPDLYVGNISAINSPPVFDCTDHVFQGGPGGLYTVTSYTGVGDDACAPMGLDVGDIDNDGDWDIYCTDLFLGRNVVPGNHMYLGNPDGSLTDNAAFDAEVLADDSWPCNFADFDLDGWIDLWVGCVREGKQDFLYINERDGTFADRTPDTWLSGLETKGGSVADYDGDGDVDVFIYNDNKGGSGGLTSLSLLYRNDTETPYNHVQFKLFGVTSNRDAIGATVLVTGGGQTQMRRVSGGDSAHSQREQILTFGVGYLTTVDVEVRWPSGIVQNLPRMGVNDIHMIDEAAGLKDEGLARVSARHDRRAGTLTVFAQSSFGGRTHLSVEGLGELRYDASQLRHVGVFPVAGRDLPAEVEVRSQRGAHGRAAVLEVR